MTTTKRNRTAHLNDAERTDILMKVGEEKPKGTFDGWTTTKFNSWCATLVGRKLPQPTTNHIGDKCKLELVREQPAVGHPGFHQSDRMRSILSLTVPILEWLVKTDEQFGMKIPKDIRSLIEGLKMIRAGRPTSEIMAFLNSIGGYESKNDLVNDDN